ncbi:MAG: GNAT family N-acetyltransferase [Armatimonadota bacterium]|nr:GNAT family N-acetyltransferase [Armatimonadota bacterium]
MKSHTSTSLQPLIEYRSRPSGSTFVELKIEGQIASRLSIIPFNIRVGAATIRIDGIGGVATEAEFRKRGYARQVLLAAMDRMREGDAALSMLYGIRDFYPKFGYATAGPDHLIELLELDGAPSLGRGWKVRPFEPGDLPSIQSLYEGAIRGATGAAVREKTGRVWTHLLQSAEKAGKPDCRVLLDPSGTVAAYAWKGADFWYLGDLEKAEKRALVLSEVIARDKPTAEAVLALCRKWGLEGARSGSERRVVLSAPPEGPVAAAARLQSAELIKRYPPCGGSMARVLNVARLVDALGPAFQERLAGAPADLRRPLSIVTDLGESPLPIITSEPKKTGKEQGEKAPKPKRGDEGILNLPQWQLARLALGAFPPDDILDELEEPPTPEVRSQVRVLFPHCSPHMYVPDRF